MIEALFHVSEVANDQGMEALLLVASKTGIELPDGDLSPADLAMHIWLYDPDLLREQTARADRHSLSIVLLLHE